MSAQALGESFIETLVECRQCGETKGRSKFSVRRAHVAQPCKDCVLDRVLQRQFGITLEDYNRLFAQQKGLCKLCGLPERVVHRLTHELQRLAVDHDHRTGEVRGLLCYSCNVKLGWVEEIGVRKLEAYLGR